MGLHFKGLFRSTPHFSWYFKCVLGSGFGVSLLSTRGCSFAAELTCAARLVKTHGFMKCLRDFANGVLDVHHHMFQPQRYRKTQKKGDCLAFLQETHQPWRHPYVAPHDIQDKFEAVLFAEHSQQTRASSHTPESDHDGEGMYGRLSPAPGYTSPTSTGQNTRNVSVSVSVSVSKRGREKQRENKRKPHTASLVSRNGLLLLSVSPVAWTC